MRVLLLAPAKRELREAAGFYDKRRDGLGNEFLDEIADTLQRLRFWPDAASPTLAGFRRCIVRRFPYALIFRSTEEALVVVAVMHLKRRPGYWLQRTRRRAGNS